MRRNYVGLLTHRFIVVCDDFSFNKVVLQREELEQRHLHLLQVVESERTARAQYAQTCEDLAAEVAKLRAEVAFPCFVFAIMQRTIALYIYTSFFAVSLNNKFGYSYVP